jgi:hypothetical protein
MDEPIHREGRQDHREEKRKVDTDDYIMRDCAEQRRYGVPQGRVKSGKSVPRPEKKMREALRWPVAGADLS